MDRLERIILGRNVFTGATGTTAVAPKFSNTLTLSQPGGHILPIIGVVAPKFFSWFCPCLVIKLCHGEDERILLGIPNT